MEHHHLDAMVRDYGSRVTTYWGNDSKPGILKTHAVTREYQFLLANTLNNSGVRFDIDLFTITREKNVAAMLDMLKEQMLRYHWSVKKATDEHGKQRTALTAKMGSLQDDLLITCQMGIYAGREITRDPARLEVIAR